MGFWSATAELRAFMFPLPVRGGPFAFVSQGGNVGSTVVTMGSLRNMGFHAYVSCGCTADIQMEDYIEYFGEDPSVKVILAYIEGLNDGKRFMEKVSRVTTKKPVVALKPGRTEAATRAISSHSGALAGSSELYDSVFRKAGVIRVDTAEELLDVAIGFVTQPLPRGRNVGIVTPGGSYGVLSADACASLGLNVIDLSHETIAAFDRIFPPRWSHGNPVDPAGDRNFIAYMKAPELLLGLPEVDAMLFMGFDSFSRFASVFARLSKELSQTFRKVILDLAGMVPRESHKGGLAEGEWMGQVITTVVRNFFSMFGTSDPAEVEAFAGKLILLLESGRVGPDLKRKFARVLRSLQETQEGGVEDPFTQLFESMFEALVLHWIETYGKPIITTTFMGSATSVTDMGYHAYPSAEQAAFVLAKLVEYREYLDRGRNPCESWRGH
jgi:acyl-CoA synthetase (NDP forming)